MSLGPECPGTWCHSAGPWPPPAPGVCLRGWESRGSSAGSLSGCSCTPALPTVPPSSLPFSEIVTFQLQAGDQRQSLPGSGCRCMGTHGGHRWPCLGWGAAGRAFRGQAGGPPCPSGRGRRAGGAFPAALGGDPARCFALTGGACPGGGLAPGSWGWPRAFSSSAHRTCSRPPLPRGPGQQSAAGPPAGPPRGAWWGRSMPPSSDRCFLCALPEAWRRLVIKWHVQRGLRLGVAAGWVLLGPCLYVCPWPAAEPCRRPGQQLTKHAGVRLTGSLVAGRGRGPGTAGRPAEAGGATGGARRASRPSGALRTAHGRPGGRAGARVAAPGPALGQLGMVVSAAAAWLRGRGGGARSSPAARRGCRPCSGLPAPSR